MGQSESKSLVKLAIILNFIFVLQYEILNVNAELYLSPVILGSCMVKQSFHAFVLRKRIVAMNQTSPDDSVKTTDVLLLYF